MATTAEGTRLADEYRTGQLAIRARSLRDLARLWPMLDLTSFASTVGSFSSAASAMVLGYWSQAGAATVDYVGEFRDAERVPGAVPRFRPAPAPTAAEVAGLVRGTALTGIINARRAGANQSRALDRGLVKTLGEVGKLVLDGGRATLIGAAKADPKAKGFERVASSGACAFCLMLVSRGTVYKSEKSSGFEAHGHCGCTGELVYRRESNAGPLAEEWQEVTAGMSGADARRAWRQHVDAARGEGAPVG